MTRKLHAAGAVVAASLLLAPWVARAQDTATSAESSGVAVLQETVRSLTAQIEAQRSEAQALKEQVAKSEAQANDAAAQIAARDAKLQSLQENLAAADTRTQGAQKDLDAARNELAAKEEAQRSLTEQAEAMTASAAAQELRLNEALAAAEKQRAELLAARNDLDSAQRAIVDKDKQIQALTNAGRELVAGGEGLSADLAGRQKELAEAKAGADQERVELMAARNDLGSAQRELVDRDKQIQALTNAARELVGEGEQLAAANVALESQLTELTGPHEAFMAALAQNLGPDSALQAVDGRLVFSNDVAFATGAAGLTPQARAKALEYGRAIAAALATLPADSPWLLRVDGHTDRQPVGGHRFESNRELAAARALAVTEVLVEAGVPPERIAPAAFGEFRPLDPADTPEAYQANRRIELELDSD
ncbi:MAG: OmpA family protein [Geminicoccaceae bacterium]